MCGIIGFTGARDCAELLIRGLEQLEYRGYDSAGIAVAGADGFAVCKAVGRIANLRERLGAALPAGHTRTGHTR